MPTEEAHWPPQPRSQQLFCFFPHVALPEKHERPLIGSCGRPATLPYLTRRTQQRTTPGYYISSESLE
ncbi:hypothetical protein JOQ06_015714 [Pogonophryne albipinna]|uniref:Uncharacterized protein n=1 Tax=Pogonophryne albipinna TaxID=1090488 RepID=A0AAD6FBY7_9TELE|nr:hypothetical protein JOQ06_015714 [Pogonophryne albipinna]